MNVSSIMRFTVCLGLCLFVGACSHGLFKKTTPNLPSKVTMPTDEERAGLLWKQMQLQGYQSWRSPANFEGIVEGDSVHGDYVRFLLNDKAAASLADPLYGSIIVKEGYDKEDGPVQGITVMQKIPGVNPDTADWFFVKYDTAGKVANINNSRCIRCHRRADGDDFVFVND